jgi:type VI secretion system protein ImpG
MFFEVDQLDFTGAQDCFDLLLVLDAPLAPEILFTPPVLRLNCVPLVNLFSQRIDPITLDHTEYEYKLMGDRDNHRYCEIYALESLESIRQDGSPRPIAPYFAMDDFQRLEQQDYFYVARRERSQGANIAGSEIFVSFLDSRFDLTQLVDEVIGGRALCTNRRLPEQILAGGAMYLEGPGPVAKIVALTKPTPHQISSEIGTRPWSLVSQLALNHLSLADGPQAMTALKDILRLHVGPLKTQGMKQIDGLLSLRCEPITRHIRKDGWRGFVRGNRIHLEMDRHQFEGASPVLFCAVLRHFFTLYATVNNLIEVSLDTQDIKGNPDKWQPLAGARPVL